jgi:hypothetical protein
MMMPLLTTLCVLGVLIVGLLVMTQAVSFEQLGHGIWRAFVAIVLVVIGAWLLKSALLPILRCVIVWLKHAMQWALVSVLALTTAILLLRIAMLTLASRNTHEGHEERNP